MSTDVNDALEGRPARQREISTRAPPEAQTQGTCSQYAAAIARICPLFSSYYDICGLQRHRPLSKVPQDIEDQPGRPLELARTPAFRTGSASGPRTRGAWPQQPHPSSCPDCRGAKTLAHTKNAARQRWLRYRHVPVRRSETPPNLLPSRSSATTLPEELHVDPREARFLHLNPHYPLSSGYRAQLHLSRRVRPLPVEYPLAQLEFGLAHPPTLHRVQHVGAIVSPLCKTMRHTAFGKPGLGHASSPPSQSRASHSLLTCYARANHATASVFILRSGPKAHSIFASHPQPDMQIDPQHPPNACPAFRAPKSRYPTILTTCQSGQMLPNFRRAHGFSENFPKTS